MAFKEKVEQLYKQIKSNPEYAAEISLLQRQFSISDEEIIKGWLFWDTKISEYSNEVYKSEVLRMVMHLHNYLKGSWHEKRQQIIMRYLEKVSPCSVVEIGFGTPQSYVRKLMYENNAKVTLCDFDDSALRFAEAVLSIWNPQWKEKVHVDIFDMNKDSLPKNADLYLFQDSIEHSESPLETLTKYVREASSGTHFVFSLPIEIENPIPEHNICWTSEQDAKNWLQQCGLNVISCERINMNKEVDLYSLLLHPNFREAIFLTRKL